MVELKTIQSTEKVDNFIESLNLPRAIAEGVFESVEDCQKFYIDFYNRNRYVADDLLDYREYKIERANISLDLFLDKCYNEGMEKAFKSTFLQSFTLSNIKLVEKAIEDGKTSLEQLFTDFKKNPNKNVLKNVL
jgi:hypothetical protein